MLFFNIISVISLWTVHPSILSRSFFFYRCSSQLFFFFPSHRLLCLVTLIDTSVCGERGINSLPNDKISDWSKLKAFSDDKVDVTEKVKFVLGREEKHCGKRRKCWLPAFSSFPTMFSGSLKLRIVW